MPLAWRNTTADTGRLSRSAAGIVFAVLLMFMQLGFRDAFLDSALELPRRLDGDLFVVSATRFELNSKDSFPRRRLYQAMAVEGVRVAAPVYAEWENTSWKNPQDRRTYALQVLAFDPDRPVFLYPEVDAKLGELKRPDTALMDSGARRSLGSIQPGIESELARRRIRIVGLFPLGPNFVSDGTLIMGDQNFLRFFPERSTHDPMLTRVEIGVVKLEPDAEAEAVRRALDRVLPDDVAVLTKDGLVTLEAEFQSSVAPVGPVFNLGTAIGFLVGMLIAYQILFTDLSEQLPQYATLKAMGYGNRYLVGVVLQQATLYALAGYVPALLLSWLLYRLVAEITLLPLRVTADLILLTLALTAGMCVLSGLIAVRRVLAADSAEVF